MTNPQASNPPDAGPVGTNPFNTSDRNFTGLHRGDTPELTPLQETRVEARGDQYMARDSVDGSGSPSHPQRRFGWWVIAVGLPVLGAGGVLWAMLVGVHASVIVGVGVAFAALLLLGGAPVWIAGVSRGREEVVARRDALADLHPSSPPVPISVSPMGPRPLADKPAT
jgi:hypothetical protein